MNSAKRSAGIALVAILALALTSATAFQLISPPRKWFQGISGGPTDLPVSLLIYQGGEESVADADNGVSAVIEATHWWEPTVQSGVSLINTGLTSLNNIGRNNLNTVSFNDPGNIVRNALAVTVIGWVDSGQTESLNGISFIRYLESDISFSKKSKFTTQAIGSCSGSYDIQAVHAHEVGHFLGLDHPPTTSALMYASIGACQFKRIANDDVQGVNTIYTPNFSGGGNGGGCTASESRLVTHSFEAPTKGRDCLLITIGFNDDCGNPVSGATVTVRLDGVEAGDVLSGSAATNSSGSVTFALRCNQASSTNYFSTVVSLTGGPAWDPNDPDNTADVTILCTILR